MRYFVTLNGREFPLRLERSAGAVPRLWAPDPTGKAPAAAEPATAAPASEAPEREWAVDVLRAARQGRPALVRVDGRLFRVLSEPVAASGAAQRSGTARVRVNGQALSVALETELERRVRPLPSTVRPSGTRIAAPMPGRIVKVNVKVGDSVVPGTALLSVEAMKMENELQSPSAGRVLSVNVQVGATVESDQELILITPES
jgi:glutaconyl-CoA/methylmalonyl-CoA decarboxylase subunit gamma